MVILTNAAGGLNQNYKVGDMMVIKDHLSLPVLALQHPLCGPNDTRFGPRFVAANNIYKKDLRELFKECAREMNFDLKEGVYATVGGPTYETITDAKFLTAIGADCVGMSTSHEG